jgi:hypothetical protein
VTRDRAVSHLLVVALVGTAASCATDLPQPWRALAWASTVACVAWALWALVVVTRDDRRR